MFIKNFCYESLGATLFGETYWYTLTCDNKFTMVYMIPYQVHDIFKNY